MEQLCKDNNISNLEYLTYNTELQISNFLNIKFRVKHSLLLVRIFKQQMNL